jgi:hypothetical protein
LCIFHTYHQLLNLLIIETLFICCCGNSVVSMRNCFSVKDMTVFQYYNNKTNATVVIEQVMCGLLDDIVVESLKDPALLLLTSCFTLISSS